MSLSEHAPSAPLVASPPFAATVNQPRSRLAHALATLRAAQPQAAQPGVVWRTPQVVQPGVVRRTTQAAEPCARVGPVVPTRARRPAPPTLAAPAHPVHQLITEAESRAARPVVVSEVTFAAVLRKRAYVHRVRFNPWEGLGALPCDFKWTFAKKVGRYATEATMQDWRKWTVDNFKLPCSVTGYTGGYMLLPRGKTRPTGDPTRKWSFSVQGDVLSRAKDEIYKLESHKFSTSLLCLSAANARESGQVNGLLIRYNLREAWAYAFQAAELYFSKTIEENQREEAATLAAIQREYGMMGTYRQVIRQLRQGYAYHDKNFTSRQNGDTIVRKRSTARVNGFPTTASLFASLVTHGARCATGYQLFSLDVGANFPSFNRIDDSSGHGPGKGRWVCRMFNNHANITRADFLHIYLNQNMVPPSETAYRRASLELSVLDFKK